MKSKIWINQKSFALHEDKIVSQNYGVFFFLASILASTGLFLFNSEL